MLVNFRGPAHTFPYYSVSDVIAHRIPDRRWPTRSCWWSVGAGVGRPLVNPMGADFPGVEIHANAIDNILTGDFIQRSDVTRGLERWCAALDGNCGHRCGRLSCRPHGRPLVAAALIVGYFAFAQYLLVAHGLLLGVLFPIATTFIVPTRAWPVTDIYGGA